MKYRVCLFMVFMINVAASDKQSNSISPTSKFHSNTLDITTLQNMIFLLTQRIEDKNDQIKALNDQIKGFNEQIKDLHVGYQLLTDAYWAHRQVNQKSMRENVLLRLHIASQNQKIDQYKKEINEYKRVMAIGNRKGNCI